jgi:hypothetical protein
VKTFGKEHFWAVEVGRSHWWYSAIGLKQKLYIYDATTVRLDSSREGLKGSDPQDPIEFKWYLVSVRSMESQC